MSASVSPSEPSQIDQNESIFEGVGDEVISGFLATSGIGLIMLYYLWKTIDWEWWREFFSPRAQAPIDPVQEELLAARRQNRGNLAEEKCLICLENVELPLETNCAHLFCSECLLKWLEGVGNRSSTTSCPACRSHISVLLKCFDYNSQDEVTLQILRRINQYNRRYSGLPRPWIEHIRDLPALFRHAVNEFFSLGGLMYMFRVRIILCFIVALIYLISPLDVLPEAVFGIIGFCDDIFVVILLGVYMTIIYRRFLASRWTND